jgi:hypothetical protein
VAEDLGKVRLGDVGGQGVEDPARGELHRVLVAVDSCRQVRGEEGGRDPERCGPSGAPIALYAISIVRSVTALELMRQFPKQDDATVVRCTDPRIFMQPLAGPDWPSMP